jgi:intracellular multiplication protein IcmL
MAKEKKEVGVDSGFYAVRFRSTLSLLIFVSCVAIGLSALLAMMTLEQEQPKFYATTTNGNVQPLYALNQPMVAQPYLLQWAMVSVRTVFNMSFANYQQVLDKGHPEFTQAGWSSFRNALDSNGVIDTITTSKLEVSAIVSGAPVILRQMIVHGFYTWQVQMPILLTYTSASMSSKQRILVTMDIMRVPTLSSPEGIQINDFVARKLE